MDDTELATGLGTGWNLGNALDAAVAPGSDETAWGNPPVTERLLCAVREAGFSTLRLPVTWAAHTGSAPDYQIDRAWMDRVETLVSAALKLDFFVIVNVHHDGGSENPAAWLVPDEAHAEAAEQRLCALWRQIAQRFRPYDNRLLFEGMNEPHLSSQWIGTPEAWAVVNRLNAAFVRTVRSCGCTRPLIVPSYAASGKEGPLSALQLPEQVILSIHSYFPTEFCFSPRDVQWAEPQMTWGSGEDLFAMEAQFRFWSEQRKRLGVPVLLGEAGCVRKPDRVRWAEAFFGFAKQYAMPCCWWDNGAPRSMGLFDRAAGSALERELIRAIVK